MLREYGVDELGDNSVFIADDAGKERSFCLVLRAGGLAEFGDEVFAELVFDATGEAGGSEFAGAESA